MRVLLGAGAVLCRTKETLQNLTLELATMGDLKLVERLQQYTLAAGASKVIRANIKVRGGRCRCAQLMLACRLCGVVVG